MNTKIHRVRVSAGGYTPSTTYPNGESKTFVSFTRESGKTNCYWSHSQTACDWVEKLYNRGELKIVRVHLYHDGIIVTYKKVEK